MLIHATCIAVEGRGALLVGPSGAGKSDLAFRLATGAYRYAGRLIEPALVSDDQVTLERQGDDIVASAPPAIAGQIEARGLGILSLGAVASVPVRLVVELVSPALVERMPPTGRLRTLMGLDIPEVALAPFEASAPAKVVHALMALPAGRHASGGP